MFYVAQQMKNEKAVDLLQIYNAELTVAKPMKLPEKSVRNASGTCIDRNSTDECSLQGDRNSKLRMRLNQISSNMTSHLSSNLASDFSKRGEKLQASK